MGEECVPRIETDINGTAGKEYLAQMHKKGEEWNREKALMHLYYEEELGEQR